MTPIAYFKLQAKNLNRDIKTQFFNEEEDLLDYKPRFFDVNDIVVTYDLDERDPKFKTLGKAQWIIAVILGLESWNELIQSDPVTLELYKLMFEHQNEIPPYEWDSLFIFRDLWENDRFRYSKRTIGILQSLIRRIRRRTSRRQWLSSPRLRSFTCSFVIN